MLRVPALRLEEVIGDEVAIHGFARAGFEVVREAFADNLSHRHDLGGLLNQPTGQECPLRPSLRRREVLLR